MEDGVMISRRQDNERGESNHALSSRSRNTFHRPHDVQRTAAFALRPTCFPEVLDQECQERSRH